LVADDVERFADAEWEKALAERADRLVERFTARQRALDAARRQRLLAELDDLADDLGEDE
jgi:hypothetical protein